MFKVYLAGPIEGLSYGESTEWRQVVKKKLEATGLITCYSPMRGKDFLKNETKIGGSYKNPKATAKAIMSRDFHDCTTADLIFANLLGAKEKGIGTAMEIGWAYMLHIPVVGVMQDTGNPFEHPMFTEGVRFRTDDLEEGIELAKFVLLP